MSLLGDRSASFIVRIWREQGEGVGAAVEWRGSIESVAGAERIYFRDLTALGDFLKTHLRRIGIDMEPGNTDPGTGPGGRELPPAGQPRKRRRRR